MVPPVANTSPYDGAAVLCLTMCGLDSSGESVDSMKNSTSSSVSFFVSTWMGELLSTDVSEVRMSSRLTDSPSVLVDQAGAMGSNMERILKAANQEVGPGAQRVLEINPNHALVQTLAKLNNDGATGLEPFARLLLDHASIAEGKLDDPQGFAGRLQALMAKAADSMGA